MYELIFINNAIKLIEPAIAPKIILIILTFLFKISDTPIKRNRSRKKFINNIKSTYIFTLYHHFNYKKKTLIKVSFYGLKLNFN